MSSSVCSPLSASSLEDESVLSPVWNISPLPSSSAFLFVLRYLRASPNDLAANLTLLKTMANFPMTRRLFGVTPPDEPGSWKLEMWSLISPLPLDRWRSKTCVLTSWKTSSSEYSVTLTSNLKLAASRLTCSLHSCMCAMSSVRHSTTHFYPKFFAPMQSFCHWKYSSVAGFERAGYVPL